MANNYRGESPMDVAVNVGTNALSFLGRVGLRRYELDLSQKAAELIGFSTDLSQEDLQSKSQELDATLNELKNTYAFSGNPQLIQSYNELLKKKDILSPLINSQGEAVVEDEFGNQQELEEVDYELSRRVEELNTNLKNRIATQKLNETIDRYINYYSKSLSDEQITERINNVISEVSSGSADSEKSMKFYNKLLEERRLNNELTQNIKTLNSLAQTVSYKNYFKIRDAMRNINNIYKKNINISPQSKLESQKAYYLYKNYLKKLDNV